jgi:hypothetical protein
MDNIRNKWAMDENQIPVIDQHMYDQHLYHERLHMTNICIWSKYECYDQYFRLDQHLYNQHLYITIKVYDMTTYAGLYGLTNSHRSNTCIHSKNKGTTGVLWRCKVPLGAMLVPFVHNSKNSNPESP